MEDILVMKRVIILGADGFEFISRTPDSKLGLFAGMHLYVVNSEKRLKKQCMVCLVTNCSNPKRQRNYMREYSKSWTA